MSGATDLLLHLRPCKVDISFDGVIYTIPALDAVQWIELLEGDQADLYEIFPALAGPQAISHVEDALWEGRVTSDAVADVAWNVLAVNADRPWWVAIRLIGQAKGSWNIVHVNRAVGMSLAGWLDEVWSKIIEHLDPKKVPAWMSDLESPPKGVAAEIDYNAEEAAFLNAMKAVMR